MIRYLLLSEKRKPAKGQLLKGCNKKGNTKKDKSEKGKSETWQAWKGKQLKKVKDGKETLNKYNSEKEVSANNKPGKDETAKGQIRKGTN